MIIFQSNRTTMRLFGNIFITSMLIFTSIQSVIGQWIPINNVPKRDYFTISSLKQSLFLGGSSFILKSIDNGITWDSLSIIDSQGNSMFVNEISSIYALNNQTIFATGFALFGNSAVILKSSDGGSSWDISDASNIGKWPRTTNVVKGSQDLIIAAGTNGFLRTSINNGTTWQQVNISSTYNFSDLAFSSPRNIFIAGDEVITNYNYLNNTVKTTTFPGIYLNTIFFVDGNTGYAAGKNSILLKTTDGGATWNKIPFNPALIINFNKIHFTDISTGFLVGNKYLFKTIDGGLTWEKLTFKHEIKGITFQDPQHGAICGSSGAISLSSQPTKGFSPIAGFSVPKETFCNDSLITLKNFTEPSNTFQWQLNGKTFSTAYNTSLSINNPSQTDTISLIAFNGTERDTMTLKIYIQASLEVNFNDVYLQHDSVCKNGLNAVIIPNSKFNDIYKLFKPNGQLESTHFGTSGSTLKIVTHPILDMTVYKLEVSRTVTGCGTNKAAQDLTVHLANPNPATIVTTATPVSCTYNSAQLIIPKTEYGVSYQLMKDLSDVGNPQVGIGAPITFNVGYLTDSSTQYLIKASKGPYCFSYLNSVPPILVENTKAYFSVNSYNLLPDEDLNIINNSINFSTYQWKFSGSYNAEFRAPLPNKISLQPGKETIRLIVDGKNGCKDTLIREVNKLSSIPSSNCSSTQIASASNGGAPSCVTNDLEGNTYFYCDQRNALKVKSFNSFTDTLSIEWPYSVNQFNLAGQFLIKVNKFGITQWILPLRMRSSWATSGNVDVDSLGNIYLQFFFGDHLGYLDIYSTDGSYERIYPPHLQNNQAVIVIKYNKEGKFKWAANYLDYYTNAFQKNALRADGHGNVYVGSERGFHKFDANGVELFGYNTVAPYNSGNTDIEIGQDGSIYVLNEDYLVVQKYSSDGVKLWQSKSVTKLNDNTTLHASGLEFDQVGNMYIAGNFAGKFLFNGETVSDPYVGGNLHNGGFIAKLDDNGKHIWLRQIKSNGGSTVGKGFDFKNDEGYYFGLITNYSKAQKVELLGYGTLDFGKAGGYFMVHFNKNGTILEFLKIYEAEFLSFSDDNRLRSNLSINPVTNQPNYVMSINSPLSYGNSIINQLDNYTNYFISQGNLDCIQPPLPTGLSSNIILGNELSVYPNPAVGNFTIAFPNALGTTWDIRVISPLGKVVYTTKCSEMESEKNLSLLGLPTGLYVVEILAGSQLFGRKIQIVNE